MQPDAWLLAAAAALPTLALCWLVARAMRRERPVRVGTVSGLNIYPIKSCAGVPSAQLSLDRHGPVGDRRLMVVANDVVDDYNVADICLPFLTQRQEPRMALIRAALSADGRSVQLSMAGRPDLTTDLPGPAGPSLLVRVWRDQMLARDCGDGAAAWLTAALGRPCRLVSASHDMYERHIDAGYVPAWLRWWPGGPSVGFADGFPLLLLSTASLDALNARCAANGKANGDPPSEPLPMARFRPNVTVDGVSGAFAEDGWRRVRIGEATFRVVKGCSRCKITTTDQRTAQQGHVIGADGVTPEPLYSLGAGGFRKRVGEVYFGQNLVHEWPMPVWWCVLRWWRGLPMAPRVRVGDAVELLEAGPPVWDRVSPDPE